MPAADEWRDFKLRDAAEADAAGVRGEVARGEVKRRRLIGAAREVGDGCAVHGIDLPGVRREELHFIVQNLRAGAGVDRSEIEELVEREDVWPGTESGSEHVPCGFVVVDGRAAAREREGVAGGGDAEDGDDGGQ